ncbi:MAG: hypothetical protein RLZZ524_807, partial [Pseudomonadota bacterium]
GDTTANAPKAPGADKFAQYVDKLRDAYRATQDLSIAEQARIDIVEGKLGKLTQAQADYVVQLAAAADEAKRATTESQFGSVKGTEKMEAAEKRRADALRLATGSMTGKINALTKAQADLVQASIDGDISATEYAQAMEVLGAQLDDLVPKFQQAAEVSSEFAAEAARNIQSAIGSSLEAALSGNFKSIGRLWADLIKQMLAQAAAARISEALFGAGYGKSTNQIGGWIGALLALFGGSKSGPSGGPYGSSIGVMATGTNYVPRDMLAYVHKGEAVVPAKYNPAAGGSAGATIVIQGDASASTVRLISMALAQQEARLAMRGRF